MSRDDVIAAGVFDAIYATIACGTFFIIALACLGICWRLALKGKQEASITFGTIGGGILLLLAVFFPMLGDVFSVWYAPNYYIERFSSRWQNSRLHIEEPPHSD